MNLDLDELIGDWSCARDEISARIVMSETGEEAVQLRVDLGLLQMAIDGRPDGKRYRGFATVYDYFQHEFQIDGELDDGDWRELHRELQQCNYRRLALSSLAEDALCEEDADLARRYLHRALRDIDRCLDILETLEQQDDEQDAPLAILPPTLIFNRARLLTNLRVAEKRYEEAIEEAERGVGLLSRILESSHFDEEQRDENPAVAYLEQTAERLRERHGISRTLRERLDDAIEREDFETAARLRDELNRRRRQDTQPRLPSPKDG